MACQLSHAQSYVCESYGRLTRLSIHSLFSNLVSVHVLVEDVFCSAPIDIMKTFIHSQRFIHSLYLYSSHLVAAGTSTHVKGPYSVLYSDRVLSVCKDTRKCQP